MALRVRINGANSFEIARDCVQRIKFRTDIPLDSDVGVKNVGSTLEIRKKLLAADNNRHLALCLVVPPEETVCVQARKRIVNAGTTERKDVIPRTYVVDYKEDFLSSDGIGQFMVAIRQKKGKPDMIAIERGYISA